MSDGSLLREPRSVLVTGGSGFIGSAFIRYLLGSGGFAGSILNLDALTYAGNPQNLASVETDARYRFAHGDIRDEALVAGLVKEAGVDTIVHFAAESHVDRSIVLPDAFIQTNLVGTFQLLEVARKVAGIHFHHVSTDEVFGSLGPTGEFREDTPYQPNSPYSASKAGSDHLVRAYARTYGLSVTVSSSSNNYGPFQFPEKLIPLMISNLCEDKPLPLYGDGLHVRDWLYVDDHVEAIWTIVRRGQSGQTYNVGGKGERTNLEIVRLLIENVARELGRDVSTLEKRVTFVKDRPGHDRRYAMDGSKLERELGWSPRHDLSAGLRDTVRWYLANTAWTDAVRTGAYREWMATNYDRR